MEYRKIYSFDKTEINSAHLLVPLRYDDLFRIKETPLIARGAGLSYCNAASANEGYSIDMSAFNRILYFDNMLGKIKVESGITVGHLTNFLISRGWILPVLPGYPSITVGGCAAFNVHGKSQFRIGTFQDWIEELVLFHPDHGEITCSKNENAELFDLTIGGMGFTGIILTVTLRLRKIKGNRLEVKAVKASNLTEAVEQMRNSAESWDYVYSWNNFNLRNCAFGKGVVYLERHVDATGPFKFKDYKNKLAASGTFPNLHSSMSIQLMNAIYYMMENIKPSSRFLNLSDTTFPIYGKEIYYYFFGKRGFREYQVLFPLVTWEQASDALKSLIENTRMPIALGSMKIFRGATHYLSFSGEGVCIVIDVPNNMKSVKFFETLDEITLKYQGIINLSKDSRASYELISQIFPAYSLFKERINTFDPKKIFVSDLRTRLKI